MVQQQPTHADHAEDDRVPVVPFVPFRCPSCGAHKPFTSNVRGRLRMHHCQASGQQYRSWELGANAVQGWSARPIATM